MLGVLAAKYAAGHQATTFLFAGSLSSLALWPQWVENPGSRSE